MSRRILALLLTSLLLPAAAQWQLGEPHKPFVTEETPRQHPRWKAFDLQHLRLELELDLEQRRVSGHARLELVALHTGQARLSLDAVALDVVGVLVDGEPAEFFSDGAQLDVQLPARSQAGQAYVVQVAYSAEPAEGLYFVERLAPDGSLQRTAHTQGQSIFHRHWLPCLDEPNDMASSEMLITVPAEYHVLSNGRLVLPEGSEADEPARNADGTRTWHWQQSQPHVSYLLTLVVGRFDIVREDLDGLPLSYYAPEGLGHTLATFARTPRMIEFFARTTGVPYPWDKYAQVAVLGYQGGAMENTSATTLHKNVLRSARALRDTDGDPLIAHELAHQWFGDLVTCRDWSHVWLNEGFADYFEALWMAERDGPDALAWAMAGEADWYFYEDAHDYRRALVAPRYARPDDLFDGHTYAKGAWVLHMLRGVVGDEAFFGAIADYLQAHAHSPVVSADLQAAFEAVSGQELDWFFRQWLDAGGHPEYRIAQSYRPEQGMLVLQIEQVQHTDALTGLFEMPVDIALVAGEQRHVERVTLTGSKQEIWIPFPVEPELVLFDPEHQLLCKLDFPKSSAALIAALRRDPHVLGRRDAGFELCRRLDEPEARAALAGALVEEADRELRGQLLRELGGVVHGWRWQPWRRDWAQEDALQTAEGADAWVREQLLRAWGRARHPHLRAAALRALYGFEGEQVWQAARTAARDEQSEAVRAAGVRVLAQSGAPDAREVLLQSRDFASHRELVRGAVLTGLEALEDEAAYELAAEYLLPIHDQGLRRRALQTLERVGADDPQTPRLLWPLLEDPDRRLVALVMESLGRVGGSQRDRTVQRLEDWLQRQAPRHFASEAARQALEALSTAADGG